MLRKVPLSNDSLINIQMKMYTNDLHKAEMANPPEPPPWTLATLINNIAVDLSTAIVKEASVVEEPKKPSSKVLTSDYKCANCGEEGDHFSYDCKENVCEDCNFNFCPGGRAMLCAMLCVEKPSKRGDQIVNFFGKPLRATAPKLIEKLDRAWENHHKKN
jgi:DNA-directed RNA polymerase subunit RPC12/RpoP